jgi:ribosomal protein L2
LIIKGIKDLVVMAPTVRGVAMNAIDHPHGGKTKSIKYPKTP